SPAARSASTSGCVRRRRASQPSGGENLPASSGHRRLARRPDEAARRAERGKSGDGLEVERCLARFGQYGGYALAGASLPHSGDQAATDQFTGGGLVAERQAVDEEVRYAAAGEFGRVLGHRAQGGPLSMVQLDDRPRHGRAPFLLPGLSPGRWSLLNLVIAKSHWRNVADDTKRSRRAARMRYRAERRP